MEQCQSGPMLNEYPHPNRLKTLCLTKTKFQHFIIQNKVKKPVAQMGRREE